MVLGFFTLKLEDLTENPSLESLRGAANGYVYFENLDCSLPRGMNISRMLLVYIY